MKSISLRNESSDLNKYFYIHAWGGFTQVYVFYLNP
jgi:hypothetical protein